MLKGFGFSGYRSIGSDLAKITPINKINLIIGKNNTGKSNIVNYLAHHYAYFCSAARGTSYRGHGSEHKFLEIDKHISSKKVEITIAFPLLKEDFEQHVENIFADNQNSGAAKKTAIKLLKEMAFFDSSGSKIWFKYSSANHNGKFKFEFDLNKIKPILDHNEWYALWSKLMKKTGGSIEEHWIPQVMNSIAYVPPTTPEVELIPAIRKIGKAGSLASDYSGEGIIEKIAKLQNPALSDQNLKRKFQSINRFVQKVLENPDATIEIPYERDMILVHMDGKTLPLDSLGTGVHEVIILAVAATLLDKSIVCVEEPELHIHPLLQKQLIKYLADETDNQYFFTTHSAHLLDTVEAQIFHVTMKNGVSDVTSISNTRHRSNICKDLGYKASDILQANCVIWVEGPSDRIYLNYWLQHKNANLKEGIHYSIMFYGGRLFSHLTALDKDEQIEELEDFITLRSLNRHSVIMFDSDKDKQTATLSRTKQRLRREFNNGSGFAWVTRGREVENYLDHDRVELSVKSVHPSASRVLEKGQWSNLLKYKKNGSSKNLTANKVKVARHYIANNKPDLKVLDLNAQLEKLCSFISAVNDIK